jgi:hypothetical protein
MCWKPAIRAPRNATSKRLVSVPMPRLPMPPTDKKAYSKNTKEQYEALGRFVEAFELMVDEIR